MKTENSVPALTQEEFLTLQNLVSEVEAAQNVLGEKEEAVSDFFKTAFLKYGKTIYVNGSKMTICVRNNSYFVRKSKTSF